MGDWRWPASFLEVGALPWLGLKKAKREDGDALWHQLLARAKGKIEYLLGTPSLARHLLHNQSI